MDAAQEPKPDQPSGEVPQMHALILEWIFGNLQCIASDRSEIFSGLIAAPVHRSKTRTHTHGTSYWRPSSTIGYYPEYGTYETGTVQRSMSTVHEAYAAPCRCRSHYFA